MAEEAVHICVDIETLGNEPMHGVMMTMGAVAFTMDVPIDLATQPDPEKGKALLETQFYEIINVRDQLKTYNWEIEVETLSWWLGNKDKARMLAEMLSDEAGQPIDVVFKEFAKWVAKLEKTEPMTKSKTIYLWSHGVTFDCMHLSQKWPQVTEERFTQVVPFRNMRDTRTLFALYEERYGSHVPVRAMNTLKHHALTDAWHTALLIQLAWNELKVGRKESL